ncbi:MAG TPA: TonB-dependent receptor [Steroidobacteraceae bacterium]|nr:TonB-dependent receptor [Steroidobacteraceae bacterium]
MVNNSLGNPLVRAAVRTVLTGGALAASFGVAHAQSSAQQTNTQQTNTQQTNTQSASTQQSSSAPQLLAQNVPAPAAPASAASLQLQEVVVTGSRIATPNQTSISPVQFVGAQQFAQVGATRVEDVLNRLPQVFADQNSTSINGGTGTETVDLRGLGTARTLVLVDGQRMPYGDVGTSGADLNMIPTALIENVQILTGGASAQYGSDAVAGVVNFKLLNDFQGVKLVGDGSGYFHDNNNDQGVETTLDDFNASHPTSHFNAAPSSVATGAVKNLTFIAGLNTPDNKGNATFYASYRDVAPALQSLYSYSACSMDSGYAPPYGNGLFACGGSHTSNPGTFYFFTNNGNNLNEQTIGPGGVLEPVSNEPLFNYGPLNYYQAPEETWNAGSFMHYQFNEHAEVYSSTMFMSNQSLLQIAYGGDFGSDLNVDCANPYLSASELGEWCGGSTAGYVNSGGNELLILRRNVEGQDRVADDRHQDWRMVVGIKGAITDNWTYDVSYQYSQVTQQDYSEGDLSKTKMGYALDAVDVLNGAIVKPGTPGATLECRTTFEGNTTGLAAGCVPWNIFSPGMVTPAMENYLGVTGITNGTIVQQIIDSNFTGDLSQYVQLPTAHSGLQVAAGTEYIDWDLATVPDVTDLTGDEGGSGGPTSAVSGAIESFSEYVEARLPLLQDKPFAQSLTTDDTIRHSQYATGFATNTFSLGLAWQPIHDVRLRGTFSRAVRAPNITELYSPQLVELDGSVDPCAGIPKYSEAQCARTGVTAAEYGNGAVGTTPTNIVSNSAAQYNGLTGGNPNLQPETATTKTFGIQFTPSFLQNFSASIDYYDIKIAGIIKGVGENTILNECAGEDLFCSLIHRGIGGTLWLSNDGFVTDTLQNVGQLEEKGIDVQLNYAYDLGRWGSLTANFTGTHIQNYITTPIAALPSTSYDCAGYYGATCSTGPIGAPVFAWRHDMMVTWVTPLRALSVTGGWRFLSGATIDTLNPNPNVGVPGATIANGEVSSTDAHIPAYNYLDLSAAYQITDGFSVRLGCNNLMDKSPPVIGDTDGPALPFYNGNTLPGTYDWGGRYVFGEVDVQF